MAEELDLTEEQVEEIKEAFTCFDTKGEGSISAASLKEVMKNLGQEPSDEEIQNMISEVGCGESGSIDFDDFLVMMAHVMQCANQEEELKEAFRMFDGDGNGVISIDELRQVVEGLGHLSPDEVEDMIKEADIDGDGQVNYEEFVEMMTGK
ncbi:calmodulin-like [Anneissia japonica]|uniref:calmodulin-like n=1 Tax=Anneissia japonica TaxID=1529436 RepID=UPI00142556AD|nr:calmodulin-like [Anneissia japonica]XP_033106703.1 calmodulin-like [Anneissia japonica]